MDELENLYHRHASAVLRFAWGLCGDYTMAEDIVSETFFSLLTKAPKIETRTARAYLLAIARNTYLSGQRTRRREVPIPHTLATDDEDLPARIDAGNRLESVLGALQDLTECERTALLLRVDNDLSYEEIAATLNITVAAAKIRVHRARLRLAQSLEPKGDSHETRSNPECDS